MGFTEDQVNNMSYVFFEGLLEQLGRILDYTAIVNYAGNSFCEKSWQMIEESNPMNIANGTNKRRSQNTLLNILESNVKFGKPVIKGKE